jgi:hypothetical protein
MAITVVLNMTAPMPQFQACSFYLGNKATGVRPGLIPDDQYNSVTAEPTGRKESLPDNVDEISV